MNVLVTGGGGFLGKRMVELSLQRGDNVRFLARGSYPDVENLGAKGFQVDLRDRERLKEAVDGVDVVYHVAAKAGFWGPRQEFWSINVDGTRNLLDAMEAAGTPKLVYTSTPSVLGYDHDAENIGNEVPRAEKHESLYGESKAEAERMVLAANSRHIATVALRPHLIFGPGDQLLLPRVLQRAREGRLAIVGDGKNKVDLTYIDNAALAHLDAAIALTSHEAPCAGKPYFISNDEPMVLWDWVCALLEKTGNPKPKRQVSLGTARAIGAVLEMAWKVLPLKGEPPMTRFLASAFAKAHWYDMGPAKRDLGYTVRVSMEQGTQNTVEWLKAAGK